MTPYEIVKANFSLPVELYPFLQDVVNNLGVKPKAGYYLDVGCGKTLTSIASALYKLRMGQVCRVICVMPPILLTNWSRNLAKIPGVTHTVYRGTPKQREEMNLGTHFTLVGYQIFKKDFPRFVAEFGDETVLLICDEGQAAKNVGSDTYKKVRDFTLTNHLIILSGTPMTTPADGYAYVSLLNPGVYRSLYQFLQVHVAEEDFFGKPTKWRHLDLLKENMEANAVFITQREALKDLPPVTYNPIFYDLAPEHLKLYKKLAEEQLVKLVDGQKIDLTHASALLHALSQIPMNAEHFSEGKIKSTGFELLDEIMSEMGDGKLVVFTQYRMTNRRLIEYCKKYNAVAVFGDLTAKQQQANIDRFVNDPACRMIILQQAAGGVGVDLLQTVSNTVLFLELGYTSTGFEQAVARVLRAGQTLPVTVHIAVAVGTVQRKVLDIVLQKDSLLGLVQHGAGDLKAAIYGDL